MVYESLRDQRTAGNEVMKVQDKKCDRYRRHGIMDHAMTSRLLRDVVYPIYQMKKGLSFSSKVTEILPEIERTERMSRDGLRDYQSRKLRRLIKHAYENVQYYYEIMKERGLVPQDIKTIEDIKLLPVLTKEQVKKNRLKLIARDYRGRKVFHATTGGSTGEPLEYLRDFETLAWTEASALRGMSWAGYQLGALTVDLMSPNWPSFLGKVRGRLLNYHYFPAFAQDRNMIEHLVQITNLSPFCLIGFASNLYRIAKMSAMNNLDELKPPVIFSTAEILYDFQRSFIEEQFLCTVHDYYGCNEVGTIAHECDEHSKHVSAERLIVETTDFDGKYVNEGLGQITVTDLHNYAMPFIRYINGDAGMISEKACLCGRTLPVIARLEGRTQDVIKTPDGNNIYSIFFPTCFRELRGIKQYQIVQNDLHSITMMIVKNEAFSSRELDGVLKILREAVGEGVRIDVEECPSIPKTSLGKTRLVISHVPTNKV